MADEEITCGAKVGKKLAEIRNHFVLCGYGRVGAAVCRELKKRNQMTVIIEKDRKIVEEELWKDPDVLAIPGDATGESTLIDAGIKRARGVIITTGDDVNNLFITLAARDINPCIWAVVRAGKSENIKRLRHAGADRVISPETSGGEDIYFAAIEPTIMKITEMHDVANINREAEIILKYGCTLENIEYHLPEFKEPLERKIEISKIDELNRFLDSLESDLAKKRSLERIYESVSGIHSHWISGPDKESLNNVARELKKEEFLLGTNLNDDEIREARMKYGRIVEVIMKPEMKITETHTVGDIGEEAGTILKHGCTLEDIEYYLPGFREPLSRKIGLSDTGEMERFLEGLEQDPAKIEYLERLYALSGGGIHSHTISGSDTRSLNNVEKDLMAKGFLLGINLYHDEIITKIKEYGRVVELLLKHEVSDLNDKRTIINLGGRILDSRYYLPGIRQVVTRKLYINSIEDVENCEEELKNPDARMSLEALYNMSRQIHSHTVAAPDIKIIEKIREALDEKGIVLGVNLSEERIWEIVESENP